MNINTAFTATASRSHSVSASSGQQSAAPAFNRKQPWPAGAAIMLAVSLALGACDSSDNTTTTTQAPPVASSVSIGANQAFLLRPGSDGNVVAGPIGKLSVARSPADLSVSLALSGTSASSFSLASNGDISLTSPLAASSLPLTVTAEARLEGNSNPVATATLTFYAEGTTNVNPGGNGGTGGSDPTVTFTDNQGFGIVAGAAAGVSFEQVIYTAQGLSGNPVFSLSGADATSFTIDAAARLAPSPSASLTVGNVLNLVVEAYSDTARSNRLAMTAVTVTVRAATASISIAPVAEVRQSLPLAAGAAIANVAATVSNAPNASLAYSIIGGNGRGLFAIDNSGAITAAKAFEQTAEVHILRVQARDSNNMSLVAATEVTVAVLFPTQLTFASTSYAVSASEFKLSETSSAGLCLVSLGPPASAGSGCAADVFVLGDDGSGAVSYTITGLDNNSYLLASSKLVLRQGPDYPANGRLRLTVTATRGTEMATANVDFEMLAPVLAFERSSYNFASIPLDVDSGTVLGVVQASATNGHSRNALTYAITAGNTGDRFAIDSSSGAIAYNSDQSASAGESVRLTLSASRTGVTAATAQVLVGFVPAISLGSGPYTASVANATNFPDHYLLKLDVSSTPAEIPLRFSTTGDNAHKFRVDPPGLVRLAQSLTGDTTVMVRAESGGAQAMANVTVTVTEADFLAFPAGTADSDGLLVHFSAVTPSSMDVSSYAWDFGDSANGTGAETAHLYQSEGDYTVELTMTLADSTTETISHKVSPYEAADPLLPLQWYLRQTLPSPYLFAPGEQSSEPAALLGPGDLPLAGAGEDIRAPDPNRICGVRAGCRGEGVVVRVIDSGMQETHTDLAPNYSAMLSWNTAMGNSGRGMSNYRDPGASISLDLSQEAFSATSGTNLVNAHGTNVTAVVAARDNNGIGGRGVAPRATISSYDPVGLPVDLTPDPTILSFQFDDDDDNLAVDVINMSFGGAVGNKAYIGEPQDSYDAITRALSMANGGRGIPAFKAAGNDGDPYGSDLDKPAFGNRDAADAEELAVHHGLMVVSSLLSNGYPEATSDAGDNVLISAYGGPPECASGVQYAIESPFLNPLGIVTADLVGTRGATWRDPKVLYELDRSGALGSFGFPANAQDYDYCFGGTSAAAPQVSGAAALMLQANPMLSWRDVRAILVETARPTGLDYPGWVRNGANYLFNPAYGFGVVNTEDAVAVARGWTLLPAQQSYRSPVLNMDSAISDCSTVSCDADSPDSEGVETAFSHTISLPSGTNIDFIETIDLGLRLEFTKSDNSSAAPLRGTVEITLEHLDGDEVVQSRSLLHKLHPAYRTFEASTDEEDDFPGLAAIDWKYLSLRHYGESPEGSWRLVITDHADDEATITLKSWEMQVRGYCTDSCP